MTFFAVCSTCRKRRFHIKHRWYKDKRLHPLPLKSTNELCADCFKRIKELTKPKEDGQTK